MIARHLEADGWRGRVFSPDSDPVPDAVLRQAVDDDVEDGDRHRVELLRSLFRDPLVRGTAHPGVDPADVCHVYLDGGDAGPLFACVVVSEDRVRAMLEQAPLVVEGLSLQVASGRQFTGDAIRAALEAWAARNFDVVPAFSISPWLDPNGPLDPAEIPAGLAALDEPLPSEWNPALPVQGGAFEEARWSR